MTTEMKDSPQPLFTFGIIADIQYADIDDGLNFSETRKRYYRNSIRLLRNALERWNEEIEKPLFILQLGDIIDGFNKRNNMSDRALNTVMKEFDSSLVEIHHVWGNHEFYNFSRNTLLRSVLNSSNDFDSAGGFPSTSDLYAYHFSPVPGYRFVLLDAYDVSIVGREEFSGQYRQAISLLKAHNNNDDLNHPPARIGLKRFVKFNGGFSQDQLDWLEGVLSSADHKMERVTIVSHLPIHPNSTDPICLAWNYDELLTIIHGHKSVVCFMAGHDHDGGFHSDLSGVHHLTLEGVIETPPGSDAFGTVSVYEDRMVLKGFGRVADQLLMYP